MNKVIKDQLEKINRVIVPKYDDNTTLLHFSKADKYNPPTLVENRCYLIQVEDYIVHPFEGFDLHINWNKNVPPKHVFMKVQVLKRMGKMVQVASVGYDMKNHLDTNDMWDGWLPEKSIKILEEI